jgi:hypothetical protein
MGPWRFLDYVTSGGQNLITEWYASQEEGVQSAFDGALRILGATENWLDPPLGEFKVLTGRHAGLCEIRFDLEIFNPQSKKWTKRKFRPATIWFPEERSLVLLIGCEKSGRIYTPHNAFDLALEHKRQYEAGNGTLYEHFL